MGALVTFGETPLRLSPPGDNRVERADTLHVFADGTESNVAIAATALGTDALWVSKLPETAMGRNVAQQIHSAGVETDIVWTTDSGRQGLTFNEYSSAPREERCWQDRAETAISTAAPGEFPMDKIQNASIVYTALSTAVLSEQTATTAEAILRASNGSGAVTAVELDYSDGLGSPDAFKQAFERLSEQVDILITPENVIDEVLGESGTPREVTNTLSALYDLQIVVIRRADGSAIALHDTPGTNVIHERSTVETETVDPAGVQSAFTGGFLHELIQGTDAAGALTTAVATAAFAETLPGPFLTASTAEIEDIATEVIANSQ